MTTENIGGLEELRKKLLEVAKATGAREVELNALIASHGDDAFGLATLLQKLREDHAKALEEKGQLQEIRRMARSFLQPPKPAQPVAPASTPPTSSTPTSAPKPAVTKPDKPKNPPTSTPPTTPKPATTKPVKPKDPSTPSATATAVAINGGGFIRRVSDSAVAIITAIITFIVILAVWMIAVAPNAQGSAEWAGSLWTAVLIAGLAGGGVFFLVDRRNS
jgi:hypothetical protein